jgi:hypothetical protein
LRLRDYEHAIFWNFPTPRGPHKLTERRSRDNARHALHVLSRIGIVLTVL